MYPPETEEPDRRVTVPPARVAVAPGVDERLAAELARWRAPGPGPAPEAFTLAWLVAARGSSVGRHHLGEPLLTELADIRVRHRVGQPGHDPYLDAFLDCVLARHQGRFHNRTYLALTLLELILTDERSHLDPERLATLLMADVIRHENRRDVTALDAATLAERTRQAARFVAETDPSMGTAVPTPPGTAAGDWFPLTVLPVTRVHDEYVFIRALQAHELVFRMLTGHVQAGTEATLAGELDRASDAVRRAVRVFRRAVTLCRVTATMRAADFRDVRQHTEGVSAVRSEAYERFELALGPGDRRPGSEEAAGVQGVETGPDDLNGARAALRATGGPDHALAELDAAMAELEASHQEWKAAHRGPAARMLADAPGSGHPAGVPRPRRRLVERLLSRGAT